jgi:hypothetical protein
MALLAVRIAGDDGTSRGSMLLGIPLIDERHNRIRRRRDRLATGARESPLENRFEDVTVAHVASLALVHSHGQVACDHLCHRTSLHLGSRIASPVPGFLPEIRHAARIRLANSGLAAQREARR